MPGQSQVDDRPQLITHSVARQLLLIMAVGVSYVVIGGVGFALGLMVGSLSIIR